MWGRITVKITSADVPGLLREIMLRKVVLGQLQHVDGLTFVCTLDRKGYTTLYNHVIRRGDAIEVIDRQGIGYRVYNLIHRPFLICGISLLLFMSIWLPTRILFVDVVGNTSVPTRQILEVASSCGIRFAASRREIRSEQVKNRFLSELPDLQWVGVNTQGCVAEISVKEKAKTDDMLSESSVTSIVAARDGVITGCTVQKGTLLCSIGHAVKAGQALVSGYTDCGYKIRATAADAEIFADTEHDLTLILPQKYSMRLNIIRETEKYGVIIGKKLINFSKDSGISDAMCVKMYSRKYLTLPGGRALPVAFVIESQTFYKSTIDELQPANAKGLLETYGRSYLLDQMIAGQIIHAQTDSFAAEDNYLLQARYVCNESIGQIVREERFYTNGEND